jgi:hypothetical protein
MNPLVYIALTSNDSTAEGVDLQRFIYTGKRAGSYYFTNALGLEVKISPSQCGAREFIDKMNIGDWAVIKPHKAK